MTTASLTLLLPIWFNLACPLFSSEHGCPLSITDLFRSNTSFFLFITSGSVDWMNIIMNYRTKCRVHLDDSVQQKGRVVPSLNSRIFRATM
uniref:Putative secreted protein n=1 Tax=Panstrongylus lignarius TaxID=156445 RepID=A0A224XVJ0_9HEMI